MAEHVFKLHAAWQGGRNSIGEIESGQLKTKVSIPPEMDGPGIGTNPDEMLLGAAATCYIITLAAMLERSKISTLSLEMNSEGIVAVEKGVITYKKIQHMPVLTIPENTSQETIAKIHRLITKAEESCMISRAVKGNVEISAAGKILIGER
ncbi:SACOL1771 family peroxiredoxin [Falsibacillus pallidus]|uniref:Peroxiredoxin-like protein n=1 Tax=Falsibacillus pallidus TaxID=493781 RepID=A0A370GVN0_9BACI|nr:SACOL1771 family peroxiredoxin [Falsibacillus pallidus]RDI47717.1 peroxiredoxin-like protein [Falsibacillus pallidus]